VLILADARHLPLRDRCVQCVVTSPPYWGLRDYGVGAQLGLEATPELYVAQMVQVFREVQRVLADDGVLWLNIGDSYNSHPGQRKTTDKIGPKQETNVGSNTVGSRSVEDCKAKDLVGIPWLLAFALRADGWYLRSDIIWSKPNPMPESVTDRPTKAHEYLFLLTKAERYYYDADAIKEIGAELPHVRDRASRMGSKWREVKTGGDGAPEIMYDGTRNKRSVWNIATMPYAGAHFATMPEKLVEPCLLAGCPVGGLVLDPFVGSGTVGAVAERLGRRWVGTDLSYQPLASARTAQRGLRW